MSEIQKENIYSLEQAPFKLNQKEQAFLDGYCSRIYGRYLVPKAIINLLYSFVYLVIYWDIHFLIQSQIQTRFEVHKYKFYTCEQCEALGKKGIVFDKVKIDKEQKTNSFDFNNMDKGEDDEIEEEVLKDQQKEVIIKLKQIQKKSFTHTGSKKGQMYVMLQGIPGADKTWIVKKFTEKLRGSKSDIKFCLPHFPLYAKRLTCRIQYQILIKNRYQVSRIEYQIMKKCEMNTSLGKAILLFCENSNFSYEYLYVALSRVALIGSIQILKATYFDNVIIENQNMVDV